MLLHVHTRAFSTLPVILSAISHFHSRFYLQSPTFSRSVTRSLEGAKRLFGSPSIPRKIITKEMLDSLFLLTLQPDASFITVRTIWRIFIRFYGLLRFNPVSNLTFSDISISSLQNQKPIKPEKAIGFPSPLSQVLLPVLSPLHVVIYLFFLILLDQSCLLSPTRFLLLPLL